MARLMHRLLAFVALASFAAGASAEPVTSIIAAIGSAIGAASVTTLATYALTAISVVSQIAAQRSAKRKAKAAAARQLAEDIANIKDRLTTVLQTDAANTVIYGEPGPVGVAIAAVMTGGQYGHLKHLVCVLAAHECEGVLDVQIEGVSLGTLTAEGYSRHPDFIVDDSEGIGANDAGTPDDPSDDMTGVPAVNVQVHLSPGGVDTADAFMRASMDPWPASAGLWTELHRLSGYTYIVVTLNQFAERFQGGLPQITATVRGKKVHDPRTGLKTYSRNPALILSDFLQSREGYLAADHQIDTASVIAAANACDVPTYDAGGDRKEFGGSAARYTCDGMFRSEQDRDSTRQQIEDCMAGYSLESGGVWRILAGAWTTPVMALADDDMLAPTTVVQTCNPGTARYNGAKGTYVNLAGTGINEDFKPYVNATFLAADEKAKNLDLVLPFTSSHVRTHQIARVMVEQSRGGFVLQIHPKMSAWALQPGDRVTLSSLLYGFTDKTFRVQDWTYSANAPLAIQLVEDEETFYDLVDETRSDPSPNTNLPNPWSKIAAPQGVQMDSGEAYIVDQGDTYLLRALAEWQRSRNAAVLQGGTVRVQWTEYTEDTSPVPEVAPDEFDWQSVDLPGYAEETYILGLRVGGRTALRVQFRSTFSNSDWSYGAGHEIEGAPKPTEVVDLALTVEQDGIRAAWQPVLGAAEEEGEEPTTNVALASYASTRVSRGDNFETSEVLADVRATSALIGWFPHGLQTVWATHVSTGGRLSDPVTATIDVLVPLTPVVGAALQGRQVVLSWPDCRTTQPIRAYRIYSGAALETAELVASVPASPANVMAPATGLFNYWVIAEDMGGNLSEPGYREANVLLDFGDLPDIQGEIDRLVDRIQEGRDELALLGTLRDDLAALIIRGAMQADAALASSTTRIKTDLGEVIAAAQQYRTEAADANAATARQITTIAAQYGANIAALTEELTATATAQQTTAESLTVLSATFSGNQAAVAEQLTTLATASSAQATSITGLSATVADNQAFAVQKFDTQATLNSAQASTLTGLSAAVANNHAAATERLDVQATALSAQAASISVLGATVADNYAQVISRQDAASDALAAQASTLSLVSAQAYRARTYLQGTAPTAPQIADLWINTSEGNRMYRWSGANWQPVEDTRIGQNTAAIASEANTRASAVAAQAAQITALTANVGTIASNYVQRTEVSANINAAIALNNTFVSANVEAIRANLQGQVNSVGATAGSTSSAVAGLNGNVSAQYMIQTAIVGGTGLRYMAGLKVGVSSTDGGATAQTEVAVLADKFLILPQGSSASGAAYPFKVQDGTVYIDEARIRNADIGTLKVGGDAVVTALTASGGSGSASVSFTVPAGQVWRFISQATWGNTTPTPSPPSSNVYTLTGGVSVTAITQVFTQIHPGETDSFTYSYALPPVTLAGISEFGAGSHTVTASAPSGSGASNVKLLCQVQKRGA